MNNKKILLICSLGFVVQLYMLIWQYIQFNTVVNVDFESSKYKSIPAVTICLPKLLSMKRVVEYYQRYNSSSEQCANVTKAYETYQSALVNFSSFDNNNMTRNVVLNSIYKDNFESLIPNLTINQLYEMSIPISNENSFYVYGDKLNQDGSTSNMDHTAHSPIETLMLDAFLKKCFTYFSHLDEWYRNIEFDVYWMELTLVHDEADFPLYRDDNIETIACAIHSGNTIPQDYNEFDDFDMNKFYYYDYNMLKITQLKSPYKTDCHDYDQSGKYIILLPHKERHAGLEWS